jgi:hypothetical protein
MIIMNNAHFVSVNQSMGSTGTKKESIAGKLNNLFADRCNRYKACYIFIMFGQHYHRRGEAEHIRRQNA